MNNTNDEVGELFKRFHLNGIGQGGLTSAQAKEEFRQMLASARSGGAREGRIDGLKQFEPLQQEHLKCLLPDVCIGYQQAANDFDNEKELRLKELQDEPIFNKS